MIELLSEKEDQYLIKIKGKYLLVSPGKFLDIVAEASFRDEFNTVKIVGRPVED